MEKRHVIITGTGRAGTTFLVQLLTELNMDTGFTKDDMPISQKCNAGLEFSSIGGNLPYILKNPKFMWDLEPLLDKNPEVIIDHVFIPIRDIVEAVESRKKNIEGISEDEDPKSIAGGLEGVNDPDNQADYFINKFFSFCEFLSKHDIPVTFLNYPRIITDRTYLFFKLSKHFTSLNRKIFDKTFAKCANPSLVNKYTNREEDSYIYNHFHDLKETNVSLEYESKELQVLRNKILHYEEGQEKFLSLTALNKDNQRTELFEQKLELGVNKVLYCGNIDVEKLIFSPFNTKGVIRLIEIQIDDKSIDILSLYNNTSFVIDDIFYFFETNPFFVISVVGVIKKIIIVFDVLARGEIDTFRYGYPIYKEYQNQKVLSLEQEKIQRKQLVDSLSLENQEKSRVLENANIRIDHILTQVDLKDSLLESRDKQLESKDEQLESRDKQLESKDEQLESRDKQLEENNKVQNKVNNVVEKVNEISHKIQRTERKQGELFINIESQLNGNRFLLQKNLSMISDKSRISSLIGQTLMAVRKPYFTFKLSMNSRMVKKSDLFDSNYYLRTNTDIMLPEQDLIKHFLFFGWKEGRNPSEKFDISYYISKYQDVKESNHNPLLHYISFGKKEKRYPNYFEECKSLILKSNLFDHDWYLQQYQDVKVSGIDPISHFDVSGWKEGRNPSKDFNVRYYLRVYKDVDKARINPLVHYILHGIKEKRYINSIQEHLDIISKSELFDSKWYLKMNPDVNKAGIDPLMHFVKNGWKEGRDPSEIFSIETYYRQFPLIQMNPLIHYLKHNNKREKTCLTYNKLTESIIKSGFFNVKWYLYHNPDVRRESFNPISHFIENGWKEERDPSVSFSINQYLRQYPNVRKEKVNPVIHFLMNRESKRNFPVSPLNKWIPEKSEEREYNFSFERCETPTFSILLVCQDNWEYTLKSLDSLESLQKDSIIQFEVILLDNASQDLTRKAEKVISNIKYYRTETRSPLSGLINKGQALANGKYIVVLDQYLVVQKEFLSEIEDTFRDKSIGIVGCSIGTPSGYLSSSGKILLSNGTLIETGAGHSVTDPSYDYKRTSHSVCEYCFAYRASLSDKVNGFNEGYTSGAYSITDFCLRSDTMNFKTVVQPKARVLQTAKFFELESSEDERNIARLKEKWEPYLATCPDDLQNLFLTKDKSERNKTIVVFEGWVPPWDTNAGGRAFQHFIELKKALNYNVKIVFLDNSPAEYKEILIGYQRMGFEVWHSSISSIDWKEWLKNRAYAIDCAFIHRPYVAERALFWVKSVLRRPVILFNHDCHFLRESRLNDGDIFLDDKDYVTVREKELSLYINADITLTPSLYESQMLTDNYGVKNIQFIPLFFYDQPKPVFQPVEDKDIIFVAGFEHEPNAQGFFWFVENCWDNILQEHPDVRLNVVGSKPSLKILEYNNKKNITVHGYVTDERLEELYFTSSMAIIPLLTGAGLKGKLLEAMHFGKPVVGTSIALEGCPDIDTVCSPSDTPEEFTSAILELLTDFKICEEMSLAGQELISNHFSIKAGKKVMSGFIEQVTGSSDNLEKRQEKLYEVLDNIYNQEKEDKDLNGIPLRVLSLLNRNDPVFPMQWYNFPEKKTSNHVLPEISMPKSSDFSKKHVLVISPTHSEYGQGNSALISLLNNTLKDNDYVIHYLYYPNDKSPTLDNGKPLPWDHVYEIEINDNKHFRHKFDKLGNFKPNAHLIDDWCGDDLIETVKALVKKWHFDVCLTHYVWLSRCFEYIPDSTVKILETHDIFSWRDSNENVLAGLGKDNKNGSGWFSTTPSEEKKALDRADYVLAVQESDASFFKSLVDEEKIRVAGTVMPKRYQTYRPPTEEMVIGYIAGVNKFHINQVQEIYNHWIENYQLNNRSSLLIAGSIGKWIQDNGIKMPGATILGFVDDLEEFYSQCDVIVNPDFGGSGIKIKCVEALSFGKALVAAGRAMKGIDSESRYHQASNIDELVVMLEELSRNFNKLEKLSDISMQVYDQYADKNDLNRLFSEILNTDINENPFVEGDLVDKKSKFHECYLHAGLWKTGTTSIQHTMHLNFEVLKKQGYLYPESEKIIQGFGSDAHHSIGIWAKEFTGKGEQAAWGITTIDKYNDFNIQYQKRFEKYISENNDHIGKLLLSTENIGTLSIPELIKLKKFIHKYCEKQKVIIYLRRPDLWAISGYVQTLKTGTFDKYSKILKPHSYKNKIQKFISVFGKENIILRLFDPKKMVGGDAVKDFCATLGIEYDSLEIPPKRNESISPLSLAYLTEMTEYIPRFNSNNNINKSRKRIMDNIIELGLKDKKKMYTSKDSAIKYYKSFSSDFKWMKAEFFNDNSLFDENFDMYESDYVKPVYNFSDSIRVGISVWLLENEKVNKER